MSDKVNFGDELVSPEEKTRRVFSSGLTNWSPKLTFSLMNLVSGATRL